MHTKFYVTPSVHSSVKPAPPNPAPPLKPAQPKPARPPKPAPPQKPAPATHAPPPTLRHHPRSATTHAPPPKPAPQDMSLHSLGLGEWASGRVGEWASGRVGEPLGRNERNNKADARIAETRSSRVTKNCAPMASDRIVRLCTSGVAEVVCRSNLSDGGFPSQSYSGVADVVWILIRV